MAVSIWPVRERELKAPYAVLRMHFPDTDSVALEELWQWLGYAENSQNINFSNTCAVRMSLALLGAGFPSPGTYPVKAGKYKGKLIETRQRKLSNWLIHHLGEPERYRAVDRLRRQSGHDEVSFRFSSFTDQRTDRGISPSSPKINGRPSAAVPRMSAPQPDATGMRSKFGFGPLSNTATWPIANPLL
jgi:hypothetical protein